MNKEIVLLIDKLAKNNSLTKDEYYKLLVDIGNEEVKYLTEKAREVREKYYDKKVFIRGLIEISNICKNDCYYCGIRRGNVKCDRYRLSKEDILECCREGYELGFRTFVMQGGEDAYFSDEILVDIISEIKASWPDCAVTLSLGERSRESYMRLYEAGADRYLLRHETVNKEHYAKLHPENLKWEKRMECLRWLREIGFQVGCGFMVGSPYQTLEMIADELKFIEEFKPDMCGIGPFIPHKETIFKDEKAGDVSLTCILLSIIRLIHPMILLPATTALGTMSENGREKGILSGANVVMPNLSPASVRKKYMLYDNKLSDGAESAQAKASLEARINSIGYKVVVDRGDVIR
ncbi:MAG: [Lachnospiraceae bacterium]|nr:[FeFe] hydrogenase H-cluster radical SAM maturase HydE [Lachnospiraceae bacterium]